MKCLCVVLSSAIIARDSLSNETICFPGSKKIQQELARPGVLERFCDDDAQALRIRKAFVGLYALEEEAVYKMVTNAPEKYVLKPQREGGGR